MNLLDFFFPKRCVVCKTLGDYVCPNCFAKVSFDVPTMCLVCNRGAINGSTHPVCQKKYSIDGALASVVYAGPIKKLIYSFKYKPYITDLQEPLTDFFYEGLIQQEQFHRILEQESVFVPIPLHSTKLRMRDYNHAEILSKNLGKRLNMKTISVLKRIKATRTQADLTREDRLENMKDAFVVDEKIIANLQDKQLVLIDDIMTSGATMLEAAKVLKKAGIENVWGIALAHGR